MTPIEVYAYTLFWVIVVTFFLNLLNMGIRNKATGVNIGEALFQILFIVWGLTVLTT